VCSNSSTRRKRFRTLPFPAELEHVAGHVSLEDVSFRYEPDKPLIDNLSVDVRSGEVLAIVGPTGAGQDHPRQPA